MTHVLSYLRQHALAALALVCSLLALAGSSYAAFSIPAGSVGTRQLKDRAVSAAKLDPSSVAATIRAWANFQWENGTWKVQASTPDVRILRSASNELVTWRHTRFASNCMPFVNVSTDVSFALPSGAVWINGIVGPDGKPLVESIQMVIVCPSPGSQRINRVLRNG